jgi:hypothetical protein
MKNRYEVYVGNIGYGYVIHATEKGIQKYSTITKG